MPGKRFLSLSLTEILMLLSSGWMYRATFRYGSTESPELVALFSRCSRLFRLPFIPIFVFDGPQRPSMKRGKLVRGKDHQLAHSFQLMLDGFGFEWITVGFTSCQLLSGLTYHFRPLVRQRRSSLKCQSPQAQSA